MVDSVTVSVNGSFSALLPSECNGRLRRRDIIIQVEYKKEFDDVWTKLNVRADQGEVV